MRSISQGNMELGGVPEPFQQEPVRLLPKNACRLAVGWGCSGEC